MTTVILDKRNGLYAHDGLICDGSTITGTNMKKAWVLDVAKVDNTTEMMVIGGCGDVAAIKKIQEYIEQVQSVDDVQKAVDCVRTQFNDAEFNIAVMIANENGRKLFEACEKLPIRKVEEDYTALGSGRNFAIAAMDAGCSARKAVEIACNRDVGSGGTVISGGI